MIAVICAEISASPSSIVAAFVNGDRPAPTGDLALRLKIVQGAIESLVGQTDLRGEILERPVDFAPPLDGSSSIKARNTRSLAERMLRCSIWLRSA